jgi:hypothetical protein
MRYARYLRLEKYIAASDTGGVIERWRYGRRLLEDGDATTPNGNLKHGVLDKLLGHAAAQGYKISKSEINYRMQCARAYATEAEISTACGDFKTWSDLRAAGFPAVQVSLDADAEPFDPRDEDEKRRDAARDLARRSQESAGQLSLFPDDRFTELSTLAELAKCAAEMAEMTERYARKDRERAEYLQSLIDAVDGDMSKTWAEAQAVLDGEDGDEE